MTLVSYCPWVTWSSSYWRCALKGKDPKKKFDRSLRVSRSNRIGDHGFSHTHTSYCTRLRFLMFEHIYVHLNNLASDMYVRNLGFCKVLCFAFAWKTISVFGVRSRCTLLRPINFFGPLMPPTFDAQVLDADPSCAASVHNLRILMRELQHDSIQFSAERA